MSQRTTHLGTTLLIALGFLAIVLALALRPVSPVSSGADVTPIVGAAATATP